VKSPEYVEKLLRETICRPFISDKSFDAITAAFYSKKNRRHVVGVLNERIDPEYASSLGKEIVSIGLVAEFVGLPFDDRYAEKNVPLGSKVLKHIASLRKDLIREEAPEETNEVKPPGQNENSAQQTRKRVVPITGLYKHSE
jgi:hypothetical protein